MQKVAGITPPQAQQKNKVAGITPEQLKQKNTIGGITPQQILSKASGDINNYINQYKQDYERMVEDFYNPKIGAGDILGGLAYSILKGPADWLIGAGQFFTTTVVQLLSDLDIEDFVMSAAMPRMVGATPSTPSKETMERRYNALSNVVGNTMLGVYSSVAGATDQLASSLFNVDLGLVGTDGPLSFMGIPEAERFIRAAQTGNFESIYRDFANDFLFPGQLERDNRANIAETEARYEDVQNQINAVVNAAKYINNDIVEPIISMLKTDNYERFFQENDTFRLVMSVTQSIGGILSMWGIGKLGAKMGLSSGEVSSLTNAYFFSSVTGRSMAQALENGVSLQDAYTYGIGMGLTEVALENMIGFTTSGQIKKSMMEDVLARLVGGKASSIIVNVVGEGLEEVGAELAETGLSYFGENKETYVRPSNEEFFSQAVFAFTTGALASAGLSGARAISNRFTIDSKLSNLQKQYETTVQKDGIDAARKTFESRLNAILKQLNSTTARGQKFNKQGTPYTGVLNATDKDTFLFSSGLKRFFTKQNGVYALNQEQINKIDENLFKNKFGRERVVPITQTDFAFNERVQGIEFNVDMNVDESLLVPKDQLTPEGQMAFDFVLNSQIPFVFYNDATDNTQAFLDGDQNVVFVNEATLIGRTQNQILDILVTHEAIHYIKNLAPELYTKIQKEVLNMVDIKIENGIVTVSSKNKILQEFLNKTDFNGNTYAENLQTSFEDLQQYNLPQDKTNALLVEESVAYFVERMVSGKNIGRSFENNGAELQRIFTSEDINLKSLFGKDKRTIRRFERLQKQIEKAALEAARKQVTFGYLLDNLLGPDFINVLKDDIVAKHTEESIVEGFRFGIDKGKRTIMFDQDVYKIDDIFREGLGPNNFNPKRMSPEKKSPQITFKLNDIQRYTSFIEKFVLANENFSELPVIEQRAVKEKIAKYQEVQDVLNKINIMKSVLQKEAAVKTRITSEILDILTEVMTVNVNSRGISKEQEAIFFLTNRLIESLNKKNNVNDFPFVNLHNVPTIQGAKYEKTVIGQGLPEAHKTGLEIWLDAKLSIFNLDKLYDTEVFITRNKEFPTVVAVVKPNAMAIKKEVADLEKLRLVQESLLENKDAIEDNKFTLNERIQLDKFFTQKGMARNLVENVKDVLNIKQDVDLNTLNFIEPSAGAGALIDAMLDIGIEPSRIQALDISPDKNVFKEVPIIKSDFLVSDIPYSDNNVIIGNPPFGTEGDLAINFINKSAEIAPVISMILPSIFKDRKHELITDKLKLVKNILNESQRFDVGSTSRFVKTVTQTWVNKEDARFKTYPDLSVKKVTTKKSLFYTSVKYTGKTNRELTILDKDKTKMILEWYQRQNAKLPELNDKFTYKEKEYTTRQSFMGAPLKLEYLERVEIISMLNLEPDVIVLTEIMSKKGIGIDFNATLSSVDDIKPSNKYMGIRFNTTSGMDVLRAMDLNKLSQTSRLSRIGFSGDEFQKLFEETKIKMKRIDSRKMAPLDIAGNRLSIEQQVYFQDSKARVDGKLMVLYHGSPNANIESFDTAFGGTNTGVFERLTYFTNDLLTAENFSYPSKETNSMFFRQRTGEMGKIYSLYVNLENPLDFRNLRTKDINFLVQSFQEELAEDKADAERSVRRGIDNNNHQFLKIGISDVTLRKAGYDGIIAEMYRDSGIFEFGVLNPEQIKSIDNKQPTNDNKINNIKMKRISDYSIKNLRSLVMRDVVIQNDSYLEDSKNVDKKTKNNMAYWEGRYVMESTLALQEIAAYDRLINRTFNTSFQDTLDYFTDLQKNILKNGIKKPIEIHYNPNNNFVHIAHGNHRLIAALALYIDNIPVIWVENKSLQIPKKGTIVSGVVLKKLEVGKLELESNVKEYINVDYDTLPNEVLYSYVLKSDKGFEIYQQEPDFENSEFNNVVLDLTRFLDVESISIDIQENDIPEALSAVYTTASEIVKNAKEINAYVVNFEELSDSMKYFFKLLKRTNLQFAFFEAGGPGGPLGFFVDKTVYINALMYERYVNRVGEKSAAALLFSTVMHEVTHGILEEASTLFFKIDYLDNFITTTKDDSVKVNENERKLYKNYLKFTNTIKNAFFIYSENGLLLDTTELFNNIMKDNSTMFKKRMYEFFQGYIVPDYEINGLKEHRSNVQKNLDYADGNTYEDMDGRILALFDGGTGADLLFIANKLNEEYQNDIKEEFYPRVVELLTNSNLYKNVFKDMFTEKEIKSFSQYEYNLQLKPIQTTFENLIEDYFQQMSKEYSKKIRMKRVNDEKINFKEQEQIEKIFGLYTNQLLQLNKSGEYVVKNEYVKTTVQKPATYVLEFIDKNSKISTTLDLKNNEYAVSLPYTFGDNVKISNSNNSIFFNKNKSNNVVLLKELLKDKPMKLVYDLLKSTDLPFMFINNASEDGLGLYIHEIKNNRSLPQNMIFINIAKKQTFEDIFSSLLHEHIHAMTAQYSIFYTQDIRQSIADLFFTYDSNKNYIGVTKTYELFIDTYYNGNLLSYISEYDAAKDIIKKDEDIYSILVGKPVPSAIGLPIKVTNENVLRVSEELTAQFVPMLLLRDEFFFELSKINPNTFVQMGAQFEHMLKFTKSKKLQFDLLNKIQTEFKIKFKNYMEGNMNVLFTNNLKNNYTLKDINTFIKEFTSDKYITKNQLMASLMAEQKLGKKGEASQTIENILYVASLLGPTIQKSISEYTEMEKMYVQVSKEMDSMKEALNVILFQPKEFSRLFDKNMEKAYKSIATFKRFISSSQKGKKIALTFNEDGTFKDTFLENFNDNIIVLQESLTEFAQLYNEVMPSLLEAFGLENNSVVQSKVFTLLQNIESILSKDLNLSELENLITNFLSEVTITLKKDDVLVKVAEFQKQSQEQFSKNIINALKDANKKANDSILSVSRQSQSPYNDNLNNVNVIINKITKAFEKNTLTVNESRDEVLSLVSELQQYVRLSDLTYDIMDELDTGAFSSIYLQLAMLYEDSSIIRNATNMFSSEKEYFDIVKLKTLVKKFSEVRLANNINRVLTVFATKYTTSFNDTQTLDDYANDNIKSILSIETQWKTEGLSKTSSIQTPPDFFKFFADMGLQKGNVRFFDDFFREYVKADFNRSSIIQDYMENIKAFNEKHPDAFKQSLEKVDIETQYLSPIPNDVMNTIVKKIDAQFDFYNETIRQNTNSIKNIKKEIVILRNEIKELKTRKSELNRTEQAWKTINEVQKSIQQEISAALLKIQSIALDTARTKDLRDVGTKEQFIVIEMREYSIENNLTATISYGQLINMLKGIKREIETAARYELEPMNNINPTDHFKILNTVDFFDNEVSVNKGYQTAKNETDRYTILLPKEKILSYLETLVRPQDIATIDFATEMFGKIYDHVDKYFFAMYQVHLPLHPNYIGFQTLNSNLSRNFDSKVTNRRNQKPFDGMTIETTIGASTPLMIENIFGIVSNTFQRAGNYVYRRLIADYQNLMVNVQENTTFQNELSSKTSKIGRGNNFEKMVETSLSNILGYGDVDMPRIEKVLNKVLMRSVGATMALGGPSVVNQTASVATIALKNNLNFAELTRNVTLSLVPGNKFHKWLMVNNSNYYMRAIVGGIPSLAQDINTNLYLTMNEGFQKVTNFLSRHISYVDAAVLVGTFKTIFDDVRKKDSTLSEDQAFDIANDRLTEVLLFGVANTSPAFRSNFSGSKNFLLRMISRFQSESVLQISALILDRYRMLNGLSGATEKFIRDTIAYTISGIFTGIVGVVFDLLRGRVEEEDVGVIYLLNELLWQSTIGMIPYLNLITRMIQFTDEGVVAGFEPQIPLLSDIYKISESLIAMQNGQNLGRKSLRIIENMTGMLGLPLRNSVRIISTWSNFLGDQGVKSAQEMTQFFYSKSNAKMLTEGVSSGNKSQINNYVEKVYNNYTVRNEIVNLLFSVEGSKINLYDVDFFRKTVDGVSTKYTIPDRTKDSYQKLAQTSLFKTINSEAYKKLTKEEKIKAIQRVINYYQNALKSDVLDESFELLTVEEVAARALR